MDPGIGLVVFENQQELRVEELPARICDGWFNRWRNAQFRNRSLIYVMIYTNPETKHDCKVILPPMSYRTHPTIYHGANLRKTSYQLSRLCGTTFWAPDSAEESIAVAEYPLFLHPNTEAQAAGCGRLTDSGASMCLNGIGPTNRVA